MSLAREGASVLLVGRRSEMLASVAGECERAGGRGESLALDVSPGGLAHQNARVRGATREEVLESVAARQPLGRLGTDDEIAAVIVFLCSEGTSNVAGAAWSVDGGAVPVII